VSAGTQPVIVPWSPAPAQLTMAYSVCRGITRANARNFYYAFFVLPKRKRQALSAVYAFMRRCDDIADDPGLTVPERRFRLDTWLDALHRAQQGQPTDDGVRPPRKTGPELLPASNGNCVISKELKIIGAVKVKMSPVCVRINLEVSTVGYTDRF